MIKIDCTEEYHSENNTIKTFYRSRVYIKSLGYMVPLSGNKALHDNKIQAWNYAIKWNKGN